MTERGKGVETQNNKAVVFDLMCQMTQPIRTTTNMLCDIVKRHRKLELTYEQMRKILDELYHKGKITRSQEGNLSIISTILSDEQMTYPQPLEHKKHNTPPYVYDWLNKIKRDGKYGSISMGEMAKELFYDPYNPNEYNQSSAERKVRKASKGYTRGKYVMKNGMPFDTFIISDNNSINGGYRLPKDKDDVQEYLKKLKKEALGYWKKYWNMVQIASRDNQIKHTATSEEKNIHNAFVNDSDYSDDL
jgi:hypothetical protein